MLSVVGKLHEGLLVDGVCKVTEGLIDDEQGVLRAGRGCVDQIFTLKQKGEKPREKKRRMYVDEPLNLRRYYSCGMSQPYEAVEGQKSACDQAHSLRA